MDEELKGAHGPDQVWRKSRLSPDRMLVLSKDGDHFACVSVINELVSIIRDLEKELGISTCCPTCGRE